MIAVVSALALLFSASSLQATPTPIEIEEHLNTGFALEGAHRRVDCESCHQKRHFCRHAATMQRLPQRGYRRGKTAKSCPLKQSMRRLPSVIKLDQCTFRSRRAFQGHVRPVTMALGRQEKTPAISASPNACDDCHVTSTWTNVRFRSLKRHRVLRVLP